VYLSKGEASLETCILLVGTMEKVLKEVCEVSDIKPLSRMVMMQWNKHVLNFLLTSKAR
jgi:hypothetical protein